MSEKNRLLSAFESLRLELYRVVGYAADGQLKVQKYVSEGQEQNIEVVNNPGNLAGAGGAGVFSTPPIGSDIICARVMGTLSQTIAIAMIPSTYQSSETTNRRSPPAHTPPNTVPYPKKNIKDVSMQNQQGDRIDLYDNGISLKNIYGQGLEIVRDSRIGTNIIQNSSNIFRHSKSGYLISGEARRIGMAGLKKTTGRRENIDDIDVLQLNRSKRIGLFPRSKSRRIFANNKPKNPSRTEHRTVINQFDSDFKGFDDQLSTFNTEAVSAVSTNEEKRNILARNPNNILNLAPNQLIETIAGNLITPRGNILDSNFESIQIGDSGSTPKSNAKNKFLEASEVEKRAIAYMFQVNTKNNSGEIPNSKDNFVFGINKHGFMTLNVPKSPDTGVVYKGNKTEFWDGFNGFFSQTDVNFAASEAIPITNRIGDEIYPNILDMGDDEAVEMKRETGVLHRDLNKFSAEQDLKSSITERIYPTKWHNMPAAGEMLFANSVYSINIPLFWANEESGYPEGISLFKGFELIEESLSPLNDKFFDPRSYMTTVLVEQGNPAIDPGRLLTQKTSSSAYCGQDEKNISGGIYTNAFEYDTEESPESPIFEQDTLRTGGKSANLNFEGSIEASVGKDHKDQKSILLDTAGSLVAWFGSDSNGRSVVMQTDGSVALNVGGHSGDTFNSGRFDLRVNVTNKGTLDDNEISDLGSFPWESDYLISIGEHGLVIAGMSNKPMLIRNKEDLCLESSEGQIILSAFNGVKYREGFDQLKDLNFGPGEKNSKDNFDIG